MKKWIYVLIPAILLVLFLFGYSASQKELHERDRIRAEQKAQQKAEDEAKKKSIEEKAQEDAARRAKEHADEEAKIAADKQAKYDADSKRIADETAKSNADIDRYSKQVSELEIKLDTLHKKKDQETREEFDLEKQVELAEVQRRTAELEIQRVVAMIADRATQTLIPKAPAVPQGKGKES